MPERLGFFIEQRYAATVRTYPQFAFAIFIYRHHAIGSKARWNVIVVAVYSDVAGSGIHSIQPAGHRSNPKNAFPIKEQRHYPVIAYRGRVIRTVKIPLDRIGVFIDSGETGAKCADPQATVTIAGE